MRTRFIVQVEPTQVGRESEVRRELEKMGVEVEPSADGSGTIVGHADQDALRRVGELRGVRTMQTDPVFGAAGHPPDVH